MNVADIKRELEALKSNPGLIKTAQDGIDRLIGQVIAVEKKHLYQVESTSNKRRIDEIRKLLDEELIKVVEK